MNATYDILTGLSDILGSHFDGNFDTVVAELKPNLAVLTRGTVLSAVAADAGKLTKTTAGSEGTATGNLLDPSVDTAATYTDGSVTGSVARAGSFRGQALIVGVGTNAATLVDRLRDQGIYVEGPVTVPTSMEAPAETQEEPAPAT
jgi:hypothetical protein